MGEFLKCPHCGTEVEQGVAVCRGCDAEIIYGASRYDLRRGARGGGAVGGFFGAVAAAMGTVFFGWGVTPDVWLFFGGISLGALIGRKRETAKHTGEIRFFRDYHHR